MIPLDRLQKLPYNTRVKILWVASAIAAIGLIILFTQSIRNTVENSSGENLIELNNSKTTLPNSPQEFAKVERVEQGENGLKVYFNLNNNTNDILNVSKISDISLVINDKIITAQQITDRQGKPFVQKILSKTQNFGILYFEPTNAKTAQLILSNMSLENDASNIFQQTLDLNLEELNNPANVRN
ncbi:MAG: hypothetical protein A3I07_04145 [Candidatus Doudnabacteria bacterium RIFCSPLOWO2_02_FULL_42_9]|uniref:Uncharacterized protein n=1 Tax=Candidatus Doudnabacteria bacterium RIFCSPHIGHO2_01_FULL_41_86 TaxID=1817821 RepID=A0A1F5N8V7_9BACT|nr:MAG: hypothetical protein A2717_00275 [Candidatus Doudnabacteria bacterium RIFCSPHIGHO2_01_FULL_41_86]OGE75187.1 MAG: hypothetical protein A3K07_01775 [Candidatus Doudnabacteria bacterium RIFCSPHIGHO2_01_43_10]OGE86388.1 MAG: hypothetical protein A3E28_00150 [Candidatus Doudnabacteria bacterium RIFCSPHIGHO2_12_FULL_42_22]OGE87387.1 MAG: hypothetical protein A3C49_04135 [Candidatus Doudnabacteria bacterium RIFCSPHIGHO2_02_FULL_42_25]OGE92685.1 MAG: hypothetical protein A2895_03630 [Candidatus